MAIQTYFGNCQFSVPNDILVASNYQPIAANVENQIKNYYMLNVSNTMEQLGYAGSCLQLAYAGTKGFNSCTKVIKILSAYQRMIKNSRFTCQTFVTTCLQALKLHAVAFKIANTNLPSAIQLIGRCQDLAAKMESESDSLVVQANQLCTDAADALFTANEESTATEQKKDEIKRMIQETQARSEEIKVNAQSLIAQVREEKQAAWNAQARAHDLTNSASNFAVGSLAIKILTLGLANLDEREKQLNEQASYERRNAENAMNKVRQLQALQRKENAELAAAVVKLQNCTGQEKDLSFALNSLEVAVKSLGKIKTVFENTRHFWRQMKEGCEKLKTNEMLKTYADLNLPAEMIQELQINEIQSSGLDWLSLGKINYDASLAIQTVDQKVDDIMMNLPTAHEVPLLISIVAKSVLTDLALIT